MPDVQLAYSQLADALGEQKVSADLAVLESYSRDASPLPPRRPDIVVRPASIDDVVDVVRVANAFKIPVLPTGGRASIGGASIPARGGIVRDMSSMR